MAGFPAVTSIWAFTKSKFGFWHFPAFIAFCALIFLSCSTVRQIRPLAKKESAATLSLGGPITQVGKLYVPLPLAVFLIN